MEPSADFIVTFKEQTKKGALKNVLTKFPEKITELNALLKDERFTNEFDVSKDELIIPVPDSIGDQTSDTISDSSDQSKEDVIQEKNEKTRNVVVRSNPYLVEMVALLKPKLIEFIQYTLELSAGINLLIPAIEDGNNFGVEIQQECVDATIIAENDIYQRLQEIHKYFSNRAELVTKAVKHPKCEDFRLAIQERDRMFHKFLVISLNSVRNYYMNLHDLVVKNQNKIKKPKSQVSTQMLY